MVSPLRPIGQGILRRTRRRVRSFDLTDEKLKEIAHRICDQFRRDLDARANETDLRLQRYAKYRMWRSPDLGWPWPGSSNQAMPDMLEASIRMQDTLHNAVMSARPVVVARALQKDNERKQRAVDALHDTQLFVEQDGERVVEQAAESFCNDPAMTLYTAWITERREVVDLRVFDPIPDDQVPAAYFGDILGQAYPASEGWAHLSSGEGWDWEIQKRQPATPDGSLSNEATDGAVLERRTIAFYTRPTSESGPEQPDGDVEMMVRGEPVVFDGPFVRVLPYDDVICPPSAANLDIPSPSNPGGAAHVILRDYPTKDEIRRLASKNGRAAAFYDQFGSEEQLAALDSASRTPDYHELPDQTSSIAGEELHHKQEDPRHQEVTRLVCFDTYDIDDDGKTEDLVIWVLYETQQVLRVRYLTEFFPGQRPERPLATASFLPIGHRRSGISMLETVESLHDWMKETVDQMVDNGTLVNLPWFTYRAASTIKPETLRPGPGDGIPLSDPNNDLKVQQFRNDGQVFWINLLSIIRQKAERVTLQGDLQAGRVPTGASSALRTLGGIQTLLSQGEARPERILRRFFMALTRTFRQMHRFNRHYLPDEKKFRASESILSPGEDPYFVVASSDVDLDLEFDFHANVQNSSRQAVQQGLQAMIQLFVSQIAVQMGITTPTTVYRLFRDAGKALGQNPDPYLNPPSPAAARPTIDAAEAVLQTSHGILPDADPIEGAAAHLEQMQEITTWDSFGGFPPRYLALLRAYMQRVAQQAQQEQQIAAQAGAAGGVGDPLAGAGAGTGPGRPASAPVSGPQEQAALQSGELMDEQLPGAGGGANPGTGG